MKDPIPLPLSELEAGVRISTRLFVQARMAEEAVPYRHAFADVRPRVEEFFRMTDDLRALDPQVFTTTTGAGRRTIDARVVDVARYLSAPMVSKDNLRDFASLDLDTFEPLTEPVSVEMQARQIARIVRQSFDPFRFPWLDTGKSPTPEERRAAIDWTASTYALERVRTDRRLKGATEQEAAVADALRSIGWTEAANHPLRFPHELPIGQFMRESLLAGEKCDVPCRLRDQRLLAIECKVTNTPINSVKRILRETGGKSLKWRSDFGAQVLTTVVVSGVMKPSDLVRAQDEFGMFVVFQHDLRRLTDFVQSSI